MDNNPEPLVTVVMCTYRRPRLLQRAMKSVLNQTYPHFKLCIYDDASGDETPEVVAKIAKKDPRVFYHCHEKNIGVVKNQLYGSERVGTSFFASLPDDDLFLPRHLEFAMEGFKQNPEAIFSVNQSISMDPSGMIHKVTLYEDCRSGLYKPPEGLMFLLLKDPCILQGAVFRREVIEEIGFYDPEVAHISDWDYVFRIAAQFPFVINKKPGTIFFVNPAGFSSSVLNKFYWPEWLKMYRKLVDHPLLDKDTKKAVGYHLRNRLRSLLVNQGKQAVLVKDYLTARLAAETLKDFFKSKRLYLKLTVLGKLCKYFPPLRWYLKLYGSLRNVKKSFKKRNRFPEYQQYVKYLDVQAFSEDS